jgi:hypothetical protein
MKDDIDRSERLAKLTTQRAEVGDIVIAAGDLAAVIAVKTSEFGYESYKVEYLDERPLAGIDTDCFVPQEVHLLFKSTAVTDFAAQQVAEGRMSREVYDMLECRSSDEAQQVLRDGPSTFGNEASVIMYSAKVRRQRATRMELIARATMVTSLRKFGC